MTLGTRIVTAEKRPLRNIHAVVPRRRPGGVRVWGMTLGCGHYVERGGPLPTAQARCDDCLRGAPLRQPATDTCACLAAGKLDPRCGACRGFGFVERPHDPARLRGPGDYVAAWWAACDGVSDVLTMITKHGDAWVINRRIVLHPDADTRAAPQDAIELADRTASEDTLIGAEEARQASLPCARRVFIEVRSSHHTRFIPLVERLMACMHAPAE